MSDQKVMPEAEILRILERKQEGLTAKEIAAELDESDIDAHLRALKEAGAIDSRTVGNTNVWYSLSQEERKKIVVVEDDKHINDLIKISVGSGYEIKDAFEGRAALKLIREYKPDLIVLDLMLPGIDGLEICQTVKNDPTTKDAIIIIVSAADAVRNRLEGLRKGADYYIRKPFNPKELRSLVNIFLKKKGKRFDALIDLPDQKRLTKELDQLLKENDSDIVINNLKINNLEKFSKEFGTREEISMIRLVSQIIQDKINEWESGGGFVGYIQNGEFVIGGKKQETLNLINEIIAEFDRVLPFIYQDYHSRNLDLGIEDIMNPSKPGMLSLQHGTIALNKIAEKKEELAETQPKQKEQDLGSLTYEQLQQLIGSNNLDLVITRGPHGVAISVSKKSTES